MHNVSVKRPRRSWYLLLCLLIIAQSLLPLHSAPTTVFAADADINHCTDWPAASLKAPKVAQDDDITTYRASISYKSTNPFVPYADGPFIEAPKHPGWRVLIRPNQPFAVFFNETIGSVDAIQDPAPGSNQNADSSSGDTVPDFVERVYSCLVEAQHRYKEFYKLSAPDEISYFRYMNLDYQNPATGVWQRGTFYPVIIQKQDNIGDVSPILEQGITKAKLGASYMRVDNNTIRGGSPSFPAESGRWLYPHLENTIYHELAHVYQGIHRARINPLSFYDLYDLLDFWMYEGTAVYTADQALIPTCTTDLLNPPRITPGPAFPTDCRAPNIHERDSEKHLQDSDSLFDKPWLGLTNRDNAQMQYASVLFWYYIQAQLQVKSGTADGDVVRHFWQATGGDDAALYAWAKQRFPNGGFSSGQPDR